MKMPFESGFAVTSPYGWRNDPFTGGDSWHGGIDLKGDAPAVTAVMGGTVLQSRIVTDLSNRTWEWGNYVSVLGDDGLVYYYCHLSARLVSSGERVEAGQIVGKEGASGRVTGAHLHFEVRREGVSIDPAALLGIPNQTGYRCDPPKDAEPWEDEVHDWSREAVAWAVGKDVLRGDGQGNYRLGEPCTREEFVTMLYRAVAEK